MSDFLLTRQLTKSYKTHREISSTADNLALQVEADMKLLEVCTKTIHLYVDE